MIGLRAYRDFARAEPAAAFGFGLLYASCFGQTFFISLFVPAIVASLDIGAGTFGPLYAAATIGCGLLMPVLGPWYDRTSLGAYATGSFLVLGIGCVVLALAPSGVMLFGALLLLRLGGQGLLSHLSLATMARLSTAHRGVALSLASLGYVAAELTLPAVFAGLVLTSTWRSWWAAFAVVCLICVPLARTCAHRVNLPAPPESRPATGLLAGLRMVGRDRRAWLLLPNFILGPAIFTALMLYQLPLAAAKGWSFAWMAGCFTLFAATKVAASLALGPWLDRVGAAPLIALSLPVRALASVVLGLGSSPWAAVLAYLLLGASLGTGGASTVISADRYGRENVGTVRSFSAALTIFASALGPALTGMLLQGGVGFPLLLLIAGGAFALVAVPAFRVARAGDARR